MNEPTTSPRSDQLHSEQPWCVGDKLQPKMPTTYGPKAYGINQLSLRLRVRLICKMSKWSTGAESDARNNQHFRERNIQTSCLFKLSLKRSDAHKCCISVTQTLLLMRESAPLCYSARARNREGKKNLNACLSALCTNQNARFLQGRDAQKSASGFVITRRRVSSWQIWSVSALPTFVRNTLNNL